MPGRRNGPVADSRNSRNTPQFEWPVRWRVSVRVPDLPLLPASSRFLLPPAALRPLGFLRSPLLPPSLLCSRLLFSSLLFTSLRSAAPPSPALPSPRLSPALASTSHPLSAPLSPLLSAPPCPFSLAPLTHPLRYSRRLFSSPAFSALRSADHRSPALPGASPPSAAALAAPPLFSTRALRHLLPAPGPGIIDWPDHRNRRGPGADQRTASRPAFRDSTTRTRPRSRRSSPSCARRASRSSSTDRRSTGPSLARPGGAGARSCSAVLVFLVQRDRAGAEARTGHGPVPCEQGTGLPGDPSFAPGRRSAGRLPERAGRGRSRESPGPRGSDPRDRGGGPARASLGRADPAGEGGSGGDLPLPRIEALPRGGRLALLRPRNLHRRPRPEGARPLDRRRRGGLGTRQVLDRARRPRPVPPQRPVRHELGHRHDDSQGSPVLLPRRGAPADPRGHPRRRRLRREGRGPEQSAPGAEGEAARRGRPRAGASRAVPPPPPGRR